MPTNLSAFLGSTFAGAPGVQGPAGPQGVAGEFISQGVQGLQGTQGVSGEFVSQGVQGIQGLQGIQGAQGIQGSIISGIPQNSQASSYTLTLSDAGQHVSISSGGVTIPADVFSVGDTITIYNNSASNQTITQGASTTLRFAGTSSTGNRTLAQRGICTVLCVSSNQFVISGAGLT